MKSKILYFFFLIIFNIVSSQEFEIEFEKKIPLTADRFIGTDEFENIYYIVEGVLFKKSKKKIWSYSRPDLGRLGNVNMQNPFKMILFYPDFNAVMLLDNNLNELSPKIDFSSETLFNNVEFVSGSSQNNIWLFADDQKLHLYDYQKLSEKLQTQAMTFYEPDFIPTNVISTYKFVWVVSKNRVHNFNEYGVFLETIEVSDIQGVFPFRKGFVYFKDASFNYVFNKETFRISPKINVTVKDISISRSFFSIYDGNFIHQYRLKS